MPIWDGRTSQAKTFNAYAQTIEREAAKPVVYHTLLKRDHAGAPWGVDFGSYLKDEVKVEREAYRPWWPAKDLKIITTGDRQSRCCRPQCSCHRRAQQVGGVTMEDFAVTIIRLTTTTLRVPANSAAEAKRNVEEYGVLEAWSDFDRLGEDDVARVKSAKRMEE